MYKVVRTRTRPSKLVEWFSPIFDTEERVRYHLDDTYRYTGKLLGVNSIENNDGLTVEVTQTWIDKESYELYANDPIIKDGIISKIEKYNSDNGITSTVTFLEE